jgi:O-antigen ligase
MVRNEKDAKRYLWMIYVSGSLLALLFVMAARSFSFVQQADYAAESGRLSMELKIPFLGGLRILPASTGVYFGMLLCVGYYLVLISLSVSKKLLVIGFSIILALAMILGQGRGGAGATVCSIALMTLLHLKKATTKTHFGIVLIGLIYFSSLIMSGMYYFAEHSQYSDYNIRIVGLLNNPSGDANLVSRIAKWEEGFLTLSKQPLGVGFYGYQTTPDGDSSDVHNLYLYLWLCLGPIGFLGFTWIIYKFYKTFKESMNRHNDSLRGLSILGLGWILFICINGVVSMLVWDPFSVVIVWAPLGIIYAACMREKNKSKAALQADSAQLAGQIS